MKSFQSCSRGTHRKHWGRHSGADTQHPVYPEQNHLLNTHLDLQPRLRGHQVTEWSPWSPSCFLLWLANVLLKMPVSPGHQRPCSHLWRCTTESCHFIDLLAKPEASEASAYSASSQTLEVAAACSQARGPKSCQQKRTSHCQAYLPESVWHNPQKFLHLGLRKP